MNGGQRSRPLSLGSRVAFDNAGYVSVGTIKAIRGDGMYAVDWDDGYVDHPDDKWYAPQEFQPVEAEGA